ncbi:MAG: hypothetical protein GX649_00700 [Chloroflexi bacterium]|nr:hypothetical protein [Chloroflexota bacterium]
MADVPVYREWPHAPSHLFLPDRTYIVTAATYRQALLFDTPRKRDVLLQTLLSEAERWGWSLEAWAVLANHYHWIGTAPDDASTLGRMVKALHSRTAIWLNRAEGTPGRKVWHQYWDSCLTYQKSYLARLHYVHRNPRKHGLVERPEDYRWCSMGWFLLRATPAQQRTVLSFPIDRLRVPDDF